MLLQDCRSRNFKNVPSRARQLFAGMNKLKLEPQENILLGENKYVKQNASAVINSDSVVLTSYTNKSINCIQDYVIWTPSIEQGRSILLQETNRLEKILSS